MNSQQFSHTPKPWVLENHGVNDPEHGHGIVFSAGGAHRFVVIQNVGKLETVDMDVPKLVANALLIAAAPELLEALRECLEVESRYSTRERTDDARREVHRKAWDAITKATKDES